LSTSGKIRLVHSTRFVVAGVAAGLLHAAAAGAQPTSFEIGGQVASARSGQFDAADPGFGGRVAWRPGPLVGLEAELNLYPREFPGTRPFSRTRVEGLFGLTAGVAIGRLRPFARLRPGFVDVREAPAPFPCILIYPPPLACSLAAGRTLPALDIGGGVEIATTSRTFLRVDLGDRLVRYPGPVFEGTPRRIRERPFFGHDFRLATGAGLRF
jgi:hypothetical protein